MWIGIIRAMRYQDTGWKQTELCLSYSREDATGCDPRTASSSFSLAPRMCSW